ncbi:MAG: methyltransferase domain-containing protein [Alphaproteobacteria bacterium]|nr:methyltransferase domain-containing protein [Alphaproteobacteria bacterium]
MKLNLGCGQNKLPGYVNVDKYQTFAPDRVFDLEVFPWPFEDNSAQEIVMTHVLEHLGAETEIFLGIIKELYRVLTPGGKLDIKVPHPRSEGFLGDPTHVRPVSPNILSLFSKRNNREWKEKGWPNTPLAMYLDVDLEIVSTNFALTPRWAVKFNSGQMTKEQLAEAFEMYHNVVDEIHIVLRKVAA